MLLVAASRRVQPVGSVAPATAVSRIPSIPPVQLSATSHAPALGRQTVVAGTFASAGHAAPVPVQLSATSQIPAEARHDLFVEECGDQDVRLRFTPKDLSDGTLLALAEIALKAAAGVTARLSHLNVTVLRAGHQADVISLSRVLRRERDTIHAECWLFSHAVIDAMAECPQVMPHVHLPLQSGSDAMIGVCA